MTQAVRSAIMTAAGDLMGPPARLVRRRHENDDDSARVAELYFPEGLQPLVTYALGRHFASRPA